MIQTRRRTAIALALILLTTTAYGPCSNSSRIREAAKASDRIATLIGSLIDTKRQLASAGAITPDEELKLTQHLLTANTRTKQFNDFARTLTADTPETRLDLASAFNEVTNAINKLSNESIFPVKNPEAKKRLLAILNSINASIAIIDAALKG